ncbi:MAG: sigma-54-dependent Fis family transcriptional regulator [Planctomycetota bacterium]|nr:sigma-54-dependent Fis family transcriptional regulator [Planctomycetota bacterium]
MISERFAEFLSRMRRGASEQDRVRLASVLRLNRELAGAEDRDAFVQTLLDEAIRLFRAERGFVLVPDGAGRFRVACARSLDREPVHKPERKVSSTVVQSCVEGGGRALLVEDAQEGELSAVQSIADLMLRSVLCVPLRAKERTVGCLYLDHRFQKGAFEEADLPWLEAFADQAAIGLHLHDLLARVREQSARLEKDHDRLLKTVAVQAERLDSLEPELTRDRLQRPYPEILGTAPATVRYLATLDRLVDGEFPVLLVGESGTGKELAARALHAYGRRQGGPFVAVNVAAIQADLLESELFGHVRGAFTGADRNRQGLVREAEGGTLFLDEVTEMPLELQAKLLRFLEERTVRPVGGDATIPVDLRVVAATNRDPRRAVAEGSFREDLYYRLAVVSVPIPPLRERRGDLPELVDAFLAGAAAARGGDVRRATPELLDALARRSWPGNLRELRNVVLRLDALTEGPEVDATFLEPEGAPVGSDLPTLDLAALEHAAIGEALRCADGNKAEAARLLGISRRSLYDRLKRFGDLD